MHGFLLIDKPEGITSAQAVARVKRLAGRKTKVGHGGTLDPLASGLLPVALGEGTKLLSLCLEGDKTYRFTLRFGEATETDDREGRVVETSAARPSDKEIRDILHRFTGGITQTPPAYSALKVEGKRAYALARAGEVVALAPRRVEIRTLTLLERPDADHATFEVACGKGMYVRSLARDMARALGSCGHVSMLRRTGVGKFRVDNAFSLAKEEETVHNAPALEGPDALTKHVLPLETALDDIPAVRVEAAVARKLRHGQPVPLYQCHPLRGSPPYTLVAVLESGKLVALAVEEQGMLKPQRVFNH